MRHIHAFALRRMLRYWAFSLAAAVVAAVVWSLATFLITGAVYIPRESDRQLISLIANGSGPRQFAASLVFMAGAFWFVSVICFGAVALYRLPARLSKLNDANLHLCLRCWYNTDGMKAPKCPECGYRICPKQQEKQWFQHYGPLLWLNRKLRIRRSPKT
jgi:DNA-directed RNA polymerase subunit RPC12/RpoP